MVLFKFPYDSPGKDIFERIVEARVTVAEEIARRNPDDVAEIGISTPAIMRLKFSCELKRELELMLEKKMFELLLHAREYDIDEDHSINQKTKEV